MFYISTRGQAPEMDLRGVTMAGLASDGGLYVPELWPEFSAAQLDHMKGQSYVEIAKQVLWPFAAPSLPESVLTQLLTDTYASFNDPAVTPLRQLDDRHWLLELFHGPTLAFKDVALQLLGRVFEKFLSESGERVTIIGATSGDTGSAAMSALAGCKHVDVFILYPQRGPSDIQRKQMTCIPDKNVHAIAVDGSFDDCQAIVKTLFNDPAMRARYTLAAVNSINWLRIQAQMVYYFVAAAHFAPKPVSFAVPTGNFGNVYAGYAASQCGLPISKLIVANNRNDILTRFFTSGRMEVRGVEASLSPSMDIQVSSNFERLLFDLCQRDGARVRDLMGSLSKDRLFSVAPVQLGMARQIFTAAHASDDETLGTIARVYKQSGVVIDPHTAVGIAAAEKVAHEVPQPVISLACAHPAKFPQTVQRAIGISPELPENLKELLAKPERITEMKADLGEISHFIAAKTGR